MTAEEFSNQFDTLVSSYRRFKDFDKKEELDSLEFDEYEKSVFLTMAENELVVNLYTGKNTYGDSFELTEEMRRYLDSLVKTRSYTVADGVPSVNKLSDSSFVFTLPSDLAYIIYEQVTLSGSGLPCAQGEVLNVYPVMHDEYNRVRRNPFRGATRYKALRLDKGKESGNSQVEIISKYGITSYLIRYLSKPGPIILENLPDNLSVEGISIKTECELNTMLHDKILKRAVQLALASKGVQVNS